MELNVFTFFSVDCGNSNSNSNSINPMNSFKIILLSSILRNKIFSYVKDIHDQNGYSGAFRCDWYDLGCFPHLLIKYNYNQRYKDIYNTIIKDNVNNMNQKNKKRNSNDSNLTIIDFQRLYLLSLKKVFKSGNYELVEFLHQSLPPKLFREHARFSINNTSLQIIEYLHSKNVGCFNQGVMDKAAELGRFDIVKFLHYNRSEGCSRAALDSASKLGSLEMVKFLSENRTEGCSALAFKSASINGDLEVLKYLVENRPEQCPVNLIDEISACERSLPIIQYLLTNNSSVKQKITKSAMDAAARNGHLEIIRYLHENTSAQCSKSAMDGAANRGHLETVRFLHFNRSEGCSALAMEVRLNLNDCPADSMNCFAKHKDTSTLQWFKDNTTLQLSSKAYINAIESNRLSNLEWIHENTKLPFPAEALDIAATNSFYANLDIVKYLHDHGASCTTRAMNNSGSFEIASFLYHNRTEGFTHLAMENAIRLDNIQMIKILAENRSEYHIVTASSFTEITRSFYFIARLKLIRLHKKY
ncbi:hypothetical protein PPL_10770 [Heterostelium album PN500]|uniref:Ankyrin repeat protein n=1 Tax=Heterostelium pallidum (strain ATCC 26659 / Pp 5 / PN500) TaxID=670386 RepID=D3BRY0_HETP5|nr:hypothetical protein PPL_10770 [Heterostelium album PN500]EFA75717.1 hypothetical protein PPL_10770 [Heterostelium album PN500]|eukprot:XP_020427851.1 hypothetical protein PPL_10770 [Heterostelium album PN500]